jgi:hypothetical protein
VIFTHHKIYFNVTQPGSLVYNFGPAFNRYTIVNNTSVILSGTSLPPAFTVLQVIIDLLVSFISRFIAVFTLPYLLIYPLGTYWTFFRFFSYDADDFRTPLILRQPLNGLLLHIIREFNNFWLGKVPVVSFTLCISRQIFTSSLSTLCNVSAQFSANGGRMNPNFKCNDFLLNSYLKKGFNLISLYQTELCVIFRRRNPKIALLGQMAKCP